MINKELTEIEHIIALLEDVNKSTVRVRARIMNEELSKDLNKCSRDLEYIISRITSGENLWTVNWQK